MTTLSIQDKLTEDPYAPVLAIDAKRSLKDWTEAIKGAVMRVREASAK